VPEPFLAAASDDNPSVDRETCLSFDRQDPLAAVREQFAIPEGVIYLDGNSLGALPRQTVQRLNQVVSDEWGSGLIRSWNAAHWIEAPARIGDKIARLIGASAGEVIVADSTSVNLFKLLAGGLQLQPGRHFILTESTNFPTDLYIAQGLIELLGGNHALRTVERDQLERALDGSVAILMLTHVDYASGEIHDMRRLTSAAHQHGVLTLWDLSHSAGAVPLDLNASQVDLAIGCGYKYLNGGPGAPAYLFIARALQDAMRSPLAGWMGHAAPFAFESEYRPAAGITRQLAGSPPILSMLALEVAIDLWLTVDQKEARRKSMALGDLFITLVDDTLRDLDVEVASPREAATRGSQVALRHREAYRVMRALIDRGIIGDFRTPDLMRFGFASLYTRYVDIFDAVSGLREVLITRAWQRPEYATRLTVT
jgi:kynureninase